MAKISQLAAQLIANDIEQQHKTILSSNEMVELYCRKKIQVILMIVTMSTTQYYVNPV